MARVDARDDRVRRYIVYHFRYDRQCHELRDVVVDAFDNEPEFDVCFKGVHAEIEHRMDSGSDVDPGEHVSGWTRDPGDDHRAAKGHLVKRSLLHGVVSGKWVEDLELSSNISLLGVSDADGSGLRWRSRRHWFPPWRRVWASRL